MTATPSSVSSATLWKVSISASGSDAAQTAAAGPSSSSRSRATTPCGHAAEHVRRRQFLLDGLERLLGAGEVLGREEQEGQVDGSAAERRGGLARSLAGSFGRLG